MLFRCLATLAVLLAFAESRLAAEPPTVCVLRRMTLAELDDLFARGQVCGLPIGVTRGHVVHVADSKCSRLAAALQSAFWKGKVFFEDGEFINRFCGFRADRSHAEIGQSWFDGRPCIVLEYPSSSLVFANTRDEFREISPGLYLGRFYSRCPCPRLKGYFVLEMTCRD